jgi:hypothetical protein
VWQFEEATKNRAGTSSRTILSLAPIEEGEREKIIFE